MANRDRRSPSRSTQERSLHIGQKIRQMRQERGLSLTALAARAGIAKSYLSNIERRVQSNPSMLFLEKISRVFGVEVEALVKDMRIRPELDGEWVELVQEAVKAGVEKREFRTLIEFKKYLKQTDSSS
jgi:XRE family transcriptional regulator, master regulator for biofilm formation